MLYICVLSSYVAGCIHVSSCYLFYVYSFIAEKLCALHLKTRTVFGDGNCMVAAVYSFDDNESAVSDTPYQAPTEVLTGKIKDIKGIAFLPRNKVSGNFPTGNRLLVIAPSNPPPPPKPKHSHILTPRRSHPQVFS